ncbi:retrovirus-related pol polyprotein from transposon TNT 1-94, partial [Tanacetum coccineum]
LLFAQTIQTSGRACVLSDSKDLSVKPMRIHISKTTILLPAVPESVFVQPAIPKFDGHYDHWSMLMENFLRPISNSKKRYVITFTDDFSRKTWIYFLAEKSEAFATFKFYKVKVEKETGAFVRALRTDRGGEFTSLEFKSFCNENGIQRQLTAAYTPQQNGVAERKNRTIMNMVRSVLSAKQIPKTFWPEAVNWAVHVLNRSPTLALKDKTPEEAWSGIKPSVKYFRVFGCIGHVHVPDAKRIKLDSKSLKC